MGLDNPIHIAFLLILLLLVFGAKRLPEMGRSLGDGMRGFQDAISGEGTPTAATASGGSAGAVRTAGARCRRRPGAGPPGARGRSGRPGPAPGDGEAPRIA